jgi:ABC-type Mn2+/Zn2+ transport system ATPase subunit
MNMQQLLEESQYVHVYQCCCCCCCSAALLQVGGTLPGGLMMRGLSGGERKRLSIAAGILAAPAVLFLDEPTSGLDSFAALSVMGYLQRMARAAEHIIISTIHQPRNAIWQMFDQVRCSSKRMVCCCLCGLSTSRSGKHLSNAVSNCHRHAGSLPCRWQLLPLYAVICGVTAVAAASPCALLYVTKYSCR